jgi:hypothetical protein
MGLPWVVVDSACTDAADHRRQFAGQQERFVKA